MTTMSDPAECLGYLPGQVTYPYQLRLFANYTRPHIPMVSTYIEMAAARIEELEAALGITSLDDMLG